MTNAQIRAGIYLRMSLDRELGIERQRIDCTALCERLGYHGVEYVDINRSATKEDVVREAYRQMCADIRDGRIDAIITWRSDRLYRTTRDLLPLIELIQGQNRSGKRIPIETCQTGLVDLTTDSGRMTAKILAAVSENEGEVRTARQVRAAEQLAKSGKSWGPRAFGYTAKNDQLEPNEADAVRNAYTALLAGTSLYSIANQWNAAGLTSTKGNRWAGSTVRQVLMNPRYAGLRAYRGEIVADGDWPAIVDRSTWDGVNALLSNPDRNRGPKARKHLLSGLLICGKCQKPMSSGIAYGTGKANYTCKGLHLARLQEPVDKLVTGLVVGFLSRDDAADLLIDRDRPDVTELAAQAEGLRAEAKALAALLGNGQMTAEQFSIANSGIMQRLEAVESRQISSQRVRVFDGLIGAPDVLAEWNRLPLDRKRAVVQNLIEVTLLPAGRGKPFTREHLSVRWLTAED